MNTGPAALAATFLLQSATALAWMTLPVLAPHIALTAGVEPSRIGATVGLMFVGALFANLAAAGLVAAYGALRTIQIGAGVAAIGLLAAQAGVWPAIIGSAVVVGIGYGMGVPGASHLLAHHTAPSLRGLMFSVKQSGVPVGGLLAGLSLPALAVATDWRWSVVASATLCLVVAVAVETVRHRLDGAPLAQARPPWRVASLRVPMLSAMRTHADLPRVTYGGFAAAAMQGSVFALLVTFLVVRGGFDLVTAGLVFSTMHVAGAGARIMLGIAADRLIRPQPLLALLALVGAGSILVLAVSVALLPPAAVFALAAVVGATVSGWNGVFLAEVARLSPLERVSETTASSVALVFLGYAMGPLGASMVVAATGSYALAFGLLAGLLLVVPAVHLRAALIRRGDTERAGAPR